MMRILPAMIKWLLLLAVSLSFQSDAAEPDESVKPLTLKLISEVHSVQPGEPFTIGLFLKHAPEHHSYFKFPGIVGVPTSMQWTLPEGFTAGEIEWPVPERVDMRGHGAYGYKRDTLLLVEITPPRVAPATDSVTVACKVGYMCCSQQRCTPGFEDLSLTLPLSKKSQPNDAWRKRFARERAAHAREIPEWNASVSASEEHFHLKLTPSNKNSKQPDPQSLYFFSTNGWTASNRPHEVKLDGHTLHFKMPKHPYPDEGAERFQGILRCSQGWTGEPATQGMWIDLPLPAAGQ